MPPRMLVASAMCQDFRGHARYISTLSSKVMALDRVSHTLKVGTQTIGVDLPDIYKEIGDVVGVTKQGSTTVVKDSYTVNECRSKGKAIELTVGVKRADKSRGRGSHRVLCSIDKVSGAFSSLKQRKIGTDTITSVRIPRKRRRG
jgi:hypothetical protein